MRGILQDRGYVILKSAFSSEDIALRKKTVLEHVARNVLSKNAGGLTIPDFLRRPDLACVASMKDNVKIQTALKEIFGAARTLFIDDLFVMQLKNCFMKPKKLHGKTFDEWRMKTTREHGIGLVEHSKLDKLRNRSKMDKRQLFNALCKQHRMKGLAVPKIADRACLSDKREPLPKLSLSGLF